MSKALAIYLCFAAVLVLGILTLGQETEDYDSDDNSGDDSDDDDDSVDDDNSDDDDDDYRTICRINDRQGLCFKPDNCPFPQKDVQESIPPQCESRDGVARVCCVSPFRRKLHPRPPDCSLRGQCKQDLINYRFELLCVERVAANGKNSEPGEFPHMALLGYRGGSTEFSDIKWQCGGTVISFRFVLTAGHCTTDITGSDVTHVAVGVLKRSEVGPSHTHRVKKIHKHPDYMPPLKYHDIAILEMDHNILFIGFYAKDDSVLPACLVDEDSDLNDSEAIATGWGALEYRGPNADILQKVTLRKYEDSLCSLSATYTSKRKLSRGIDLDTQICYGDNVTKMDTCQGDSGGPLHIKNDEFNCLDCQYKIIGVTSFGKPCATSDKPGVYTRVAAYLPWIDSIVWPPKEQPIQAQREKIMPPEVEELKNKRLKTDDEVIKGNNTRSNATEGNSEANIVGLNATKVTVKEISSESNATGLDLMFAQNQKSTVGNLDDDAGVEEKDERVDIRFSRDK